MPTFEMQDIPEGMNTGWTIEIDGKKTEVRRIRLTSKWGEWNYGLRPEGYGSWAYREANGGGVITIPWVRTKEGDILIGLIAENRPNIDEKPVWCAIGGHVNAGESAAQAEAREREEEAAIEKSIKAKPIAGLPINPNRLFFITGPFKNDGVKAFGLELPFSLLEEDLHSACRAWKLREQNLGLKGESQLRFFLWRYAIAQTPDALALAGISQLLANVL